VHAQTPTEYFRELVEKAIARQRLTSSEVSAFYLVQLLDSFVRPDRAYLDAGIDYDQPLAHLLCEAIASVRPDRAYLDAGIDYDQPLAHLLCEAIASREERRFTLFKATGDLSLFISGFFSDSVMRKPVDFDYYVSLGGYAYGRAARLSAHQTAAEVFEELSQKFSRFVDVLTEVSEASTLTDHTSLLRLYEKWLRTGSERTGAMLRDLGVLPVPGSKLIQ